MGGIELFDGRSHPSTACFSLGISLPSEPERVSERAVTVRMQGRNSAGGSRVLQQQQQQQQQSQVEAGTGVGEGEGGAKGATAAVQYLS